MAEEDEGKVLEAAKKLPLGEQTQHKNWKVRSQAFEGIKQTCDRALGNEDPAISEFGGWLSGDARIVAAVVRSGALKHRPFIS